MMKNTEKTMEKIVSLCTLILVTHDETEAKALDCRIIRLQ